MLASWHLGLPRYSRSSYCRTEVFQLFMICSCVEIYKKAKPVFTCPQPAYGPPSSVPCLRQFPSLGEESSERRQQHSLHSRQALRVAHGLIISQYSGLLKLTVNIRSSWINPARHITYDLAMTLNIVWPIRAIQIASWELRSTSAFIHNVTKFEYTFVNVKFLGNMN